MIDTLQVIYLKKEITVLQRQIIGSMIDSCNLALDRVKDGEQFVQNELSRAKEWLNSDKKPLNLKLFAHFPKLIQYSNGFPAQFFRDDINFSPSKADFIIDSEEKHNWFVNDSLASLKRWNEVNNFIEMTLKTYENFALQLDSLINEFNNKIQSKVFKEEEVDSNQRKQNKKVSETNYESLTKKYISACKKLSLESPNIYQLEEYSEGKPSKSTWDRKLNDKIFLQVLEKKLNQMLNKTDVNDKDFWVNVWNDISNKLENVLTKIINNKAIPFDERLNYKNQKYKVLSQKTIS